MNTNTLQTDTFKISNETELKINFIKHASLFFEINNFVIYVDPIDETIDFSTFPKADLILYTHDHFDHLEKKVIPLISKNQTQIIGTDEVENALKEEQLNVITMKNGDQQNLILPNVILNILAVPSYNTTQTQFHPKGRDNGYVLSIEDFKIYIPGDCEDMPELSNYNNLDVVFLPVNQPYTMTIEQCCNAVRMMKPKILYPFHYGDTDIDELLKKLNEIETVEVRLKNM